MQLQNILQVTIFFKEEIVSYILYEVGSVTCFYFFFIKLLEGNFLVVDTITDVPHILCLWPTTPSPPPPQPSPHCWLCAGAVLMCMYVLWLISLGPPHPLPFNICQPVPCSHASGFSLSVYFAHWIPCMSKSYGTCLSLPGLFHLA